MSGRSSAPILGPTPFELKPLPGAAVAVLALALLSVALPATVQHDAGGWVDWGREIVHGTLDTVWYPSWKPLPVLVTAPAALAGSAAPTVWLVAARAGAIAGVALAAWTASRAAGGAGRRRGGDRGRVHAGLAGVRARRAGGADRPRARARRARLRVARGRPRAALGLLALAALGRVEAWALLLGAAGWCCLRRGPTGCSPRGSSPSCRCCGSAATGSAPATRCAAASSPACRARRRRRRAPGTASRRSAPSLAGMVPVPALLLAGAGVVLGVRARSRVEPALAGAVAAWIGADAVLVSRGFAPSARFLLPAAGLLTVLAADGLLRGLHALPTAPRGIAAATCLLAVVVLHWSTARTEVAHATWFARAERSLGRAVTPPAARPRSARCGGATTLEEFRPHLAWRLDEGTAAVRSARSDRLRPPPPGATAAGGVDARRAAPRGGREARRAHWRLLSLGAPRRLRCARRGHRRPSRHRPARPDSTLTSVTLRPAGRRPSGLGSPPRESRNRRPGRGGVLDRRARGRRGDAPGGLHGGHAVQRPDRSHRGPVRPRRARVRGGEERADRGLRRPGRPSPTVFADLRTNVHDPSSAACSGSPSIPASRRTPTSTSSTLRPRARRRRRPAGAPAATATPARHRRAPGPTAAWRARGCRVCAPTATS